AAVASDGRIWVAGGEPFSMTGTSSEVYDPSTDQWTMAGDVTSGDNPNRNFVSGAIGGDGFFYVVGGDSCGGDGCPDDSLLVRALPPPPLPARPPASRPPAATAGRQVPPTPPTLGSLAWAPSTDNVRVDHYDVYRNGTRSQAAKLA